MSAPRSGFDRLARGYRTLEFIAFGRDLERARFEFLGRLAGCRDILLLGEGDGRCAERLAVLVPEARILCVDSSPGMIERASRRVVGIHAGRVTFLCADALSFAPGSGSFDAVATLFFLDCFDAADVERIVAQVGPSLRPGAPWLFADFALPDSGLRRLRAHAWLAVLYLFFRCGAGLRVSALPPSEEALARGGWRPSELREFQGGMIRSAVFLRPGDPGATGARAASP
jgi:ubiquinone/menaquinone biosynthesis C-methylase UbiE